MKIKLAFLLICSFLAVSQAFSQKTNLPPTPTPTTPAEYWAMGYENGYNLAIQGNYTIYQNSIEAADEDGLYDYEDGLMSGYTAGLAKKQVLVHPASIQSYTIDIPTPTITVTYYFSDGSTARVSTNMF